VRRRRRRHRWPRLDGSITGDAPAPLIWIDFSITGCVDPEALPAGDADAGPVGEPPCRGTAPLALEFVPVAPATVTVYEWNFGDGSIPLRRQAPQHLFTAPGSYDVTLSVQGPGGTASAVKTGIVVVEPAGVGAPCEEDEQCQSGDCRCVGDACPGASGFCTAPCAADAPCADGICADLAPGDPGDPAPWQAPVCLLDCSGGAPCPGPMVCRELLRGDEDDAWAAACFHPGLLGDIGDSCRDANGALRDDLCASGMCLAEGLRGVCSAPCADAPCPPSAACASFGGGVPGPACLARCGAGALCDADPGLACEPPGGGGDKGFTVDEPPAEAGYCAPRTCESPSDCGSLGLCSGGFCTY
jgi:hypothetical protein